MILRASLFQQKGHSRVGTKPPILSSEIMRLLGILDSHLKCSKSGDISTLGYSFANAGWVVYTHHYVQKGAGFVLDDFPGVQDMP